MIRKMFLAAVVMVAAATSSWADSVPPTLIHYQGRLTGTSGTPITSSRTLYFSIYVGGSASTANSGTLKYQEHQIVTPDTNGIFEALVGGGTVDSGAINPADFNSTSAVYLQVSIGVPSTTSNVLLPRTRFTSGGFSFVSWNAVGDITPKTVSISGYGAVINSSGQWVGPAITASGVPSVTAITDTTGGDTVSGDLIQLSGSSLSNANVFVGGRQARVKSSSASQIVFQVPAGLPMGLNQVEVSTGTLQVARNVGSIDLTRYLMLISLQDDRIVFINPRTLAVAGQITGINFIDPSTDTKAAAHIQVDFASDGALMIVPSNAAGQVYAIDLTKSPIGSSSLVQTLTVTSFQRTAAVAVQPSENFAAAADAINNYIRILAINEHVPPFSAPLANYSNVTLLNPPVPASFYPATLRYMSDHTLVTGGNNGYLQVFQNRFNPNQNRYEWSIDNVVSGFYTYLSVGTNSYQMDLTPNHDRLLLLTGGSENLSSIWTGNWFDAAESVQAFNAAGSGVKFFSLAQNGRVVTADINNNLLRLFKLTDDALSLTGVYQRPTPYQSIGTEYFMNAAIEPVEGNLVAAYVNNTSNPSIENLVFYRVSGGVLDRVDQGDSELDPNKTKLDLDGRLRLYSLLSNAVDQIGAMQFLP